MAINPQDYKTPQEYMAALGMASPQEQAQNYLTQAGVADPSKVIQGINNENAVLDGRTPFDVAGVGTLYQDPTTDTTYNPVTHAMSTAHTDQSAVNPTTGAVTDYLKMANSIVQGQGSGSVNPYSYLWGNSNFAKLSPTEQADMVAQIMAMPQDQQIQAKQYIQSNANYNPANIMGVKNLTQNGGLNPTQAAQKLNLQQLTPQTTMTTPTVGTQNPSTGPTTPGTNTIGGYNQLAPAPTLTYQNFDPNSVWAQDAFKGANQKILDQIAAQGAQSGSFGSGNMMTAEAENLQKNYLNAIPIYNGIWQQGQTGAQNVQQQNWQNQDKVIDYGNVLTGKVVGEQNQNATDYWNRLFQAASIGTGTLGGSTTAAGNVGTGTTNASTALGAGLNSVGNALLKPLTTTI